MQYVMQHLDVVQQLNNFPGAWLPSPFGVLWFLENQPLVQR